MLTAIALPNDFWTITIGNLSTIIVVFGAFVGLLWKTSAFAQQIKDVILDNDGISKRIALMDQEGTVASRIALKTETELTVSNTKQIQSLTDQILKITPTLAIIKTDLEWIKNGIRTGSIVRSRDTHMPEPEK